MKMLLIRHQNLRFHKGILHKLGSPLSTPEPFFNTAARLKNLAISRLPAPFVGLFEALTGAPGTTLFSVRNEDLEALMAANPNGTVAQFLDTLSGYTVTPAVFFENTFTSQTVQALSGAPLKYSGFGTGTMMVNDAVVVRSDIFTTNGVLHILDRPIEFSRN
ncbi:MAG: hypothetical protein L6R40_004822 [Gallowayella cf. fulva]|nr:MAG: hypothetical protein L6R40_004822 [Xanthomendoza cf. fulva]